MMKWNDTTKRRGGKKFIEVGGSEKRIRLQ